jgi:energy-converting hydrogenase Eha subunit F
MKNSIFIFLALFALAGCTGPGQLTGTGYLVTVEEGIQTDWKKLPTTTAVDSFVHARTGLALQSDSLIESRYPFYQFRNGQYTVYVEKKAVYQRENGKKRWRRF